MPEQLLPPGRCRIVVAVLALMVLGGFVTSFVFASEKDEKATALEERDRQVERLVDAAARATVRAQELHDSLGVVLAREDSLQRELEAEAAEHEQAAGDAEAEAVEIRDRWELNMVELVGVVRPPVRPLAERAKAQGDSTFRAQQTAISELRGMATSLQGVVASKERELEACLASEASCTAARDSLGLALDSMTVQRDEWRDLARTSVLEELFGSWQEGALRVLGTGAACWWSREACAGAAGIQVLEVAF